MRIGVVRIAVIILFLLLALGVFNLDIIHGRSYRELSNKNCIRLLPQQGARGKILDRNGEVIVNNRLSYDVLILPQRFSGVFDSSLKKISRVLAVSPAELKENFRKNYVSSSLPVAIARNIDIKNAIALEELKSELPGIIIQQRPLRNYPYGRLASHVIGYLGEIDRWRLTKLADYGYKTKDIVGFGGAEEKYDYYLRQEEGGLSFEVDHQGRFMRTLGFRSPRQGKDIQLTLDLRIQKIAEDKFGDRKGAVIIMDPYTGEIIAMASGPDFNPSVFAEKSAASVQRLFNDADAPMLNRGTSGVYPPGSIFKVIVAACGLQTNKINLGTSFVCSGSTMIGRQKFNCWSTHNQQELVAAIAHSCNVFFYHIGLMMGAQNIHDYALRFGLGKVTLLDIPYEAAGFIPSPLNRKLSTFRGWFDGDTANLSIGQGDCLVTPLQMARMMAVFANKGYLVTPYLVKAIDNKGVSIIRRKAVNLSLKDTTINYIRLGLRGTVSDPAGTANVMNSLPVQVAGKTGTAQAPPGQAHAWFVGFFPFKEPKFVICVFIERGGPGYYSSVLAKEIIGEMAKEGLI